MPPQLRPAARFPAVGPTAASNNLQERSHGHSWGISPVPGGRRSGTSHVFTSCSTMPSRLGVKRIPSTGGIMEFVLGFVFAIMTMFGLFAFRMGTRRR